jgi:hypothetical protein
MTWSEIERVDDAVRRARHVLQQMKRRGFKEKSKRVKK